MSKKAEKEHSRKLDQFYTNPFYALSFLEKISNYIDLESADILLEPSAGCGSFYSALDGKRRIGLDLDPQFEGIIKTDFFDWNPPAGKRIISIGNPPFGKNSGLAVKFFNRCAEFSEAIAFVIPRTFRKTSIINRLNKFFHLVYDETVPFNSFFFNGKEYDVPCAAQIWVKKSEERKKIATLKFSQIQHWFEIVPPDNSDFAIQRVGGRAGLIRLDNRFSFSKESHYFIKSKNPKTLEIFKSVNFEDVKYNTAGNPSISPSELIELFIKFADSKGIQIVLTAP